MNFKSIVALVVNFLFGTSWKTSLLGYVMFFAEASAQYVGALEGYGWHFVALAFLALARLAKDEKATGGTKPVTPEAAARVEG